MKRLFQARSVCLLLAMLIGWSVTSAIDMVNSITVLCNGTEQAVISNGGKFEVSDQTAIYRFKTGDKFLALSGGDNIGTNEWNIDLSGNIKDLNEYFNGNENLSLTHNLYYNGVAAFKFPTGYYSITFSPKDKQNLNCVIAKAEADKIESRYYYELDGVEVPMEDNGDGTYSVSLPEVVGSMSGTPDLPKTKLRLLEAKCVDNNGTAGKIVDRSYIYSSKVGDNRELKESAVAVGGSRDFDYAIADPTGKTNEEFVKYTTLLFQAARASYTITVNPATKKLTYFRKEYVPFPRRIYPNKPDDVQTALAFTRIPNDVSAEPYVRYTKGETVTFTVLKSLGLGKEYTYAPATDVVIDAGVTFTLVENGNGGSHRQIPSGLQPRRR